MDKKPESMFDKLGDLLRESLDSGFVVPERNSPAEPRKPAAEREDGGNAADGAEPQNAEASRADGRGNTVNGGGTRAAAAERREGAGARANPAGGRESFGSAGGAGARAAGTRADARRPAGGAEFRAGFSSGRGATSGGPRPFGFRPFGGAAGSPAGGGTVRPAQIYRPLRIPAPVLAALAGIGIPESAGADEAKRIYREKLQYYHPDKWLGTPYVAQAEEMTRRLIEWWAAVEKWLSGRADSAE